MTGSDAFIDYCKALDNLREGYGYPLDINNPYYESYLGMIEKYKNGEDITNEI